MLSANVRRFEGANALQQRFHTVKLLDPWAFRVVTRDYSWRRSLIDDPPIESRECLLGTNLEKHRLALSC